MKLPDFLNMTIDNLDSDKLTRIGRLQTIEKPKENFIVSNLTSWKNSDVRKQMIAAQNYYENNSDIKDRERYYLDRKGVKQKADNLANSKLHRPYMRKLVNQKTNYLLSRPFTIVCEDELFVEILNDYFDDNFRKILKNIGKEAITKGIAWLQAYYNQKGELKFKRIPSEQIKAFWEDEDHTILQGVIRTYIVKEFQADGTTKNIQKVEYHTEQGSWYYILGDSGLEKDTDYTQEQTGHFSIIQPKVDETGKPVLDDQGVQQTESIPAVWDKIPFIPFRYNPEEISLLQWVKPLIDDYEITSSDNSNNLQDIPNSIKVVKNYDGADKGEFTHNLALYRTAFVSGDGDVKTVETPFNTEAVEAHLTRLRKDIYEAACAVDTQETDLGNATGVALKFKYADLDMDSDDMGSEFASSLKDLIWFIKVDLFNKGLGDYLDVTQEIVFNTDIIINETESITQAKDSVGVISDDTILANHPWVTNVKDEKEKLELQKQQQLDDMQKMLQVQDNYGNDNPNENSEE